MKKRGKEDNLEHKDQLAKVELQQKFEDSITYTSCKNNEGNCNLQTGERQEILEDEGKDTFMNNASTVNSKGFQWKLILIMLIVIFILKGILSGKEKSIAYNFVSCPETKRMRDWKILIEKEEAWKRKFSDLHLCKGEEERMRRSVKGRKAKEKRRK